MSKNYVINPYVFKRDKNKINNNNNTSTNNRNGIFTRVETQISDENEVYNKWDDIISREALPKDTVISINNTKIKKCKKSLGRIKLLAKQNHNETCMICMVNTSELLIMNCCHQYFCIECIGKWLTVKSDCPHCRNKDPIFIEVTGEYVDIDQDSDEDSEDQSNNDISPP